MSYLQGPSLSSFTKCVISFWFRVPQASLDAALEEQDNWDYEADPNPPPFMGLVPLVVFGKEGAGRTTAHAEGESQQLSTSTTSTTCVETGSDSINGNPADAGTVYTMTYWPVCNTSTSVRYYGSTTFTYTPVPGDPLSPSYIALDGSGNLQVHFESAQTGHAVLAYGILSATSAYYEQETTNDCYTFSFIGACTNHEETVVSVGGLSGVLQILFAEIGFRLLLTNGPGWYVDQGSSPRVYHPSTQTLGEIPGDQGTASIGASPCSVSGDEWHHVLVSVDMSAGSAAHGLAFGETMGDPADHITQTSTMHVAVDDADYKTGGYPFEGTNKVYTGAAAATAFSYQAAQYIDNGPGVPATPEPVGPIPSYSLDSMSVPAAAIGIPSVSKYVDNIHHVEMAEFQMWTGQTLDTGSTAKRRLFIDAKGKPENPKTAAQSLGTPNVRLHGSGNWIKGKDTGTLGNFSPTGKIKKYRPDPELGK